MQLLIPYPFKNYSGQLSSSKNKKVYSFFVEKKNLPIVKL